MVANEEPSAGMHNYCRKNLMFHPSGTVLGFVSWLSIILRRLGK